MGTTLIVGGDSPIGRALARALEQRGHAVVRTSRRRSDPSAAFLDLETLDGLDALPDATHVAIVAAETRFSVCAAEPERTRRINVAAPAAIASRAAASGARVLFFSTIAVHDGTIDAPDETVEPRPNTEYGRQKRDAELQLLARGRAIAVLRPSKVIGPDFPLFHVWLAEWRKGAAVTPFSDMVVAPLWIDTLADAAARLLTDTAETGVFQLSATDQLGYADIASRLAERLGVAADLVRPIRATDRPDAASLWLPASARLGNARLTVALSIAAPFAADAIDAFAGANS